MLGPMAESVEYSGGRLRTESGSLNLDLSALVTAAAAYTQTYSTGGRTVAAMTAAAPAAMTAATITGGESPTEAEHNALVADVVAVRAEVVKLVADLLDVKKNLNSVIDDLQAAEVST